MADIFISDVSLTLFPQAIRQLMSADSDVGRTTKGMADRILGVARDKVGTRYSGHHGGPSIRDSGRVEHAQDADWSVVFEHPKAFLHHEGAVAHEMPHKPPGSQPRFYYRDGPGIVTSGGDTEFGPRTGPINHPGAGPNRFLPDAARELGFPVVSPAILGRASTIPVSVRGIF